MSSCSHTYYESLHTAVDSPKIENYFFGPEIKERPINLFLFKNYSLMDEGSKDNLNNCCGTELWIKYHF